MFHVKQNKKNPFSFLIKTLLQKKIFSVSGLPVGVLPSFLALTQKRVVVLVDSFEIRDFARAFEKKIGVDVACVSSCGAKSPGGFSGYYEGLFLLSKNLLI